MSKIQFYENQPAIEVITGVCPHDCPDTCSWQVAVERATGRAVDIWGHAEHPITQGKLCGKVDRYLERTYHRERLTTPLRRVGPKGSGQFEPISWATAISEIATKLQAVMQTHGAEAVLPYSYAGTMGLLQMEGMAARCFNQMGASRLARTICSEAGFAGYRYTVGAAEGMETESYAHAKFILIWGSNTLTSNLHLWPFVLEARKQGARVIVIDPANTRTAQAADEWIAIRPGSDGALALAMMQVIIHEGLQDSTYISEHTLGFAQLAERVQEYPPDRVAAITGIPAERIIQLAREYATTRPAAIRMNYGLQRHSGGGMAARTIACLPALVGAWRAYGGGIQLSTSGVFRRLNFTKLYRPGLLGERNPRTINMNRLGDALSLDPSVRARALYHPRPADPQPTAAQAGPAVQAMIVYNCNPAAVSPDQAAVLAGLRREDLFTVVLEHFQTDTADYADYLLPATTQLEHWDLHKAYGHFFLALNRPAIAPVGQSLPNSEIFRRLAQAMGYTDPGFYQGDEEIIQEFLASQRDARYQGITWERLLREGFARVNLPERYLPFAQGNFPTPSGKCEFYSEKMARDGYDPLPTYEVRNTEGAGALWARNEEVSAMSSSLICISPPAHSYLNSSFGMVDRLRGREKAPLLQIHPLDAAARQIATGDTVTVRNELGSLQLVAQVTEKIIAGTVLAPGIWWNKHSADGRNINQITPQKETDMGGSASFYEARVWVEQVRNTEASTSSDLGEFGRAVGSAEWGGVPRKE